MIYGQLVREKRHWKLTGQPHMLMVARRLFLGASANNKAVKVLDSPTVCVDLRWFIERYPVDMSEADRATLHRVADAKIASNERVRSILDGYTPPNEVALAVPARDYQLAAASALLEAGGLLLADDVGIGKTVSAIASMVAAGRFPALVVTLTHLPAQWQREINRFAPKLTTHIVKRGTPYPLGKVGRGQPDLFGESGLPDVLIMNYAKLSGWRNELAGKIRFVVFDEVQELRRPVSEKYAAASAISEPADYRLGLSATPIYNYGEEFFSVFEVLAPGSLGSSAEFTATWCDHWRKIEDPLTFGAFLRDNGMMLRRTRRDVGRELPPVTIVPHQIEADASVLHAKSGRAAELARIVLGKGEAFKGQRFLAAEELSVLVRQQTGVAKAAFVASFVDLLIESGERPVLYGWHHEVYALWADMLRQHNPVFFTGSESPAQKEAAKQAFISGEAKVMVMSLRAGAGLDGLQRASRTVVFGELDWSPGVHEQCIGRVARDGQEEPVVVYYLLADGGSDPIVADVLGVKKAQLEPVRNPDGTADESELDAGRVKKLAAAYLGQVGQV